MSPESSHVARLIRSYVLGDPEGPPVPADLDWVVVCRRLWANGLVQSVADLALDGGPPDDVREQIEETRRALVRRTVLMSLETARVCRRLRESGLEALLLKGLALSYAVYPEPHQRFTSDLDVLVRRERIPAAVEALQGLGYRPAVLTRHNVFYERHHYHFIFVGQVGFVVELHWDLSRPSDYFRFDPEALFRRARTVSIEGEDVAVLADGDQLLHAAAQALKAGFGDLRRVIDAGLLVRRGVLDEQPAVVARAVAAGVATPLWILLGLQQRLAGEPFPREFERSLRPEPFVRRCIDSLTLSSSVLDVEAVRWSGLQRLVAWLSSPSVEAGFEEVRRFLLPGVPQLLDGGHDPDRLPGWPERSRLILSHGWSLGKMLAYQGWRLVRHTAGNLDSTSAEM